MGLITKIVKTKWSPRNKKYYESLGYIFTKFGYEFEVKIENLTEGSHVEVRCFCDYCGEPLIWKYQDYNKSVKEDGKTYCKKCASKLYGGENTRKTKLKSRKSLYDWCIENDRQDILKRWDEELNDCSPKNILYKTNKKYWFKCDKHLEHKSESKNINSFTSGHEGSIKCKQCASFAQRCIDNKRQDLLDRWDYELNKCSPWEVSYGTKIKCWFKCDKHSEHKSELKTINVFTSGREGSVECKQCNSIAQYVIDNYGEEFLRKIWSDKNKISPFEIGIYSGKKVWWNCPDNKHESFKRECSSSVTCEFRCPECVKEKDESIIEEKTRMYLEGLGYKVKTEYNCTIKPINPKSKLPLPFDNEIILENEKHLIIEVHGGQHYNHNYYMTIKKVTKEEAEKELHYQQVKDRYKRIKCIQAGYEYLEIPYTAFDKKETYKNLIDNKIKEILNLNKESLKNNKQE